MGLFFDRVSRDTPVTPGRKSQCDLWGVKDNVLQIYELKLKDNKPVGIISELFFYVNVAQDLLTERIHYEDKALKSARSGKDLYAAIKNRKITNVEGIFLATNLHPLLEAQKDSIINMLTQNRRGISFNVKQTSDWVANH